MVFRENAGMYIENRKTPSEMILRCILEINVLNYLKQTINYKLLLIINQIDVEVSNL